jgi:hypothetical protein
MPRRLLRANLTGKRIHVNGAHRNERAGRAKAAGNRRKALLDMT